MTMASRIIGVKYRVSWALGALLCAVLYFSGFLWLYEYIRKNVLRNYRTSVLMYHRITDKLEDPDISVSPAHFTKHIEYLHRHSAVLPLTAIIQNTKEHAELSCDTVAITFDDGYKDNYTEAYPVLKRYGLPATIFLISSLLDKDEKMLESDQLRTMRANGIDFGSHTVTHPILSEIDPEQAQSEISDSKRQLEDILREHVRLFAYPKGKYSHYNSYVKKMVEDAGYEAACITENGAVEDDCDLYEIKRIGMRNFPVFVLKVRLSGLFESAPVYALRKMLGLT